ncbi:hypothetical protein XTPLMG728_0862 [Xanthomonas translucens pv. poae]|uniref:Uncharacterized protein n=1 Tax=Xanthomonas graminis pv. poae TaxID=227946 RepID=A0A0K2ZMD1_9XANT|nr:hypothetical protein XTPLMG728_0862 [Xanthomonas translucens pv. poae]
MRRNGEENPLWGGSGFCGALWRLVNRTTQLVDWRRSPHRSGSGWRQEKYKLIPSFVTLKWNYSLSAR